ncbi:NAD(P)-dependent oxidoreductase [Luteimicrobium album]|uniref:NAD(P)-dependent oxidoreductase n=1 Tax=Luteimicrobium album TaxID=1054550 RepID=A0ABQ6I3C8_9MICO|nr:SDR family oxidoreductase [Luteimicrobium album]GMA24289.1 NAD(P)-dependent oxidoreductase [Luteimicrobium album]
MGEEASLARVAVTGSTGHLGGLVARLLADDGVPQRLLVRSPERAPDLPGAQVLQAAYGDRDAVERALEGVEVVLFVSATESVDRTDQHERFAEAAVRAGVRHVVYTSFQGAGPDASFTLARDHAATEEILRLSGMAWTFLRDSLYLDVLPAWVGDDGVLRGPAGDGAVAAVARADVARCAAAVLTDVLADPGTHGGRAYELTGREAITLDQATRTISDVTGRSARYHAETLHEAYTSRAVYGAPRWQVDAWVSTYTAIAEGALRHVSGDVERLTGREPMTLRDVLQAT